MFLFWRKIHKLGSPQEKDHAKKLGAYVELVVFE